MTKEQQKLKAYLQSARSAFTKSELEALVRGSSKAKKQEKK